MFHEFLIRASNDRLLTDRQSIIIDPASASQFVNLVNESYRRREVAVTTGDDGAWKDYWNWWERVQFGFDARRWSCWRTWWKTTCPTRRY